MKRRRSISPAVGLSLVLLIGLLVWSPLGPLTGLGAAEEGEDRPIVVEAVVEGPVSPAMTHYVARVIKTAQERGAQAVVLHLDTPGGLVTAMRLLIKHILGAQVPVMVFVSPEGAQAASAGVMITLSAHVAAMAPGTNIGAAHPVGAGGQDVPGEMAKKVTNDMVAYARSLAQRRGRNADWAERAVRYSVSLPATEAVAEGVVDVVVPTLKVLLDWAHERKVMVAGKEWTIKTRGARTVRVEPSFKDRLLGTIANPNLAYILLMIGLLAIYFELSHPGAILPGVVGTISLILAFFAMQTLPVSLAGLLLIVVGVALFLMEIWITSYGLLSLAGVGCLTVGSIMLFDSPEAGFRLAWTTILATVGSLTAFFLAIIYLVFRAQRSKARTGAEGLIGEKGAVRDWTGQKGKIFIRGEIWNAVAEDELSVGDRVEVRAKEGLTLRVRKEE